LLFFTPTFDIKFILRVNTPSLIICAGGRSSFYGRQIFSNIKKEVTLEVLAGTFGTSSVCIRSKISDDTQVSPSKDKKAKKPETP